MLQKRLAASVTAPFSTKSTRSRIVLLAIVALTKA